MKTYIIEYPVLKILMDKNGINTSRYSDEELNNIIHFTYHYIRLQSWINDMIGEACKISEYRSVTEIFSDNSGYCIVIEPGNYYQRDSAKIFKQTVFDDTGKDAIICDTERVAGIEVLHEGD